MSELCFVDMDGVLTDFVSAACEAHGRLNPYNNPKNYGVFEMDKIWGMTAKEFWAPMEREGYWWGMKKLPGADLLLDLLIERFGMDNICILSSPSLSPYCVPEKRQWLKHHYDSRLANNVLFGSAKQFLAGPDRYLIDDYDKNIDKFEKFGGIGITYPQLWNREYTSVGRRLGEVSEALTI